MLNRINDSGKVSTGEFRTLLLLLNPFAPHVTEETWERMGFGGVITSPKWPVYDEEKCREDSAEIAVQVNGKIKTRITVPADIGAQEAIAAARADAKTAAALEGMQVLKEIYVMPAEQFKNIIIATVYRVFELFRCKVVGRIRPTTLHFAFAACVHKGGTSNNQWT